MVKVAEAIQKYKIQCRERRQDIKTFLNPLDAF
jgi:hypothetical protein